MDGPWIEIDNLKELRVALKSLESKEFIKGLRAAHKRASDRAAVAAQAAAPVRSGRLRRSITSRPTQTSGAIKAGTAARVPYAGPIHFGWGARGIEPNTFMYRGITRVEAQIIRDYNEEVKKLIKDAGL